MNKRLLNSRTAGIRRALVAAFLCSASLILLGQNRASIARNPDIPKLHPSARAQLADSPVDAQAEVTVTVGVINQGITGRQGRLGGLRDVHFAYSVPTYADGTFYTVFVPVPPGEDISGTAQAVHIPNLGGQVVAINESHVNLRFAITNWNDQPSASVTISLESQTKTAQAGATEIVFNDVPQTILPLSITIGGILLTNGKPAPSPVPGLLPVTVNCPAVGTLRPRYHVAR